MRCAYQAYKVVQYTEFTSFGRPDKAFTPHPAPEHHCLLLKIGVGRRPHFLENLYDVPHSRRVIATGRRTSS